MCLSVIGWWILLPSTKFFRVETRIPLRFVRIVTIKLRQIIDMFVLLKFLSWFVKYVCIKLCLIGTGWWQICFTHWSHLCVSPPGDNRKRTGSICGVSRSKFVPRVCLWGWRNRKWENSAYFWLQHWFSRYPSCVWCVVTWRTETRSIWRENTR